MAPRRTRSRLVRSRLLGHRGRCATVVRRPARRRERPRSPTRFRDEQSEQRELAGPHAARRRRRPSRDAGSRRRGTLVLPSAAHRTSHLSCCTWRAVFAIWAIPMTRGEAGLWGTLWRSLLREVTPRTAAQLGGCRWTPHLGSAESATSEPSDTVLWARARTRGRHCRWVLGSK